MTSLTENRIRHHAIPKRHFSPLAWVALARQRRALRSLYDRALADIGVTRNAAEIEGQRAFWDVPHNWRG